MATMRPVGAGNGASVTPTMTSRPERLSVGSAAAMGEASSASIALSTTSKV